MAGRDQPLVAWQWGLYPDGHRNRRNLMIHILTVPMFWTGTLAIVLAPLTTWWNIFAGVVFMALAMAAQGRGHKLEATPPVPFLGPADVLGRIFVEQWITFPRYVLSGGWARAWRSAR
jgi:hypothetical protein